MAAGIPSFDILVYYFLGADRRGAGNLDGNSGPPGPTFHPNFLVFLIAQNDQVQAGPMPRLFLEPYYFCWSPTIFFLESYYFFFESADLISTINILLYDPKPSPLFFLESYYFFWSPSIFFEVGRSDLHNRDRFV